jgi:hypothetical protein
MDPMLDNPPSALPHIKAAKLVALAVTRSQRSATLPDVATVAEAGPVKGFAARSWFGRSRRLERRPTSSTACKRSRPRRLRTRR